MNFPLETCPVQRELHSLLQQQVPRLCATSAAASDTFVESRKRVQEEGSVGSKEKINYLQRNKNLRKSIKLFRKVLCSMTRSPMITSRAAIGQRSVLIFTLG